MMMMMVVMMVVVVVVMKEIGVKIAAKLVPTTTMAAIQGNHFKELVTNQWREQPQHATKCK